jgi:hypothetical protein
MSFDVPKSSSFTVPVASDQDVARFQVEVHDEIAMRIAHGIANLQENLQACVHAKFPGIAILVEMNAVDIFHDQIWLLTIIELQTVLAHGLTRQGAQARQPLHRLS